MRLSNLQLSFVVLFLIISLATMVVLAAKNEQAIKQKWTMLNLIQIKLTPLPFKPIGGFFV